MVEACCLACSSAFIEVKMVDLVEAVGGREEVERCEKRWGGGSAERQAQVFLKENNCEMEMEKSGPREIRSVRDGRPWSAILQQMGQHSRPCSNIFHVFTVIISDSVHFQLKADADDVVKIWFCQVEQSVCSLQIHSSGLIWDHMMNT